VVKVLDLLDLPPALPYIWANPLEAFMLDGFKKFILRGNVVDMAVGVVIGAAFGGVVTEMTKAFLTPLIALIVGKPDYSSIKFAVRGTVFPIGDLINAVISFVLIAAAVYFFVVVPVNLLVARMHRGEKPPDPTTKQCPECLSDIPIAARRCAHCTQPVGVRAA
jgi:large conductance mechanosensitive channel